MAGRGMGAASRGGGAVSSGPKNKMVSEPSKSTGKVLMMAKGGAVRGKVQKFGGGGLLAPPGAPPPAPGVTKFTGAVGKTVAKHVGPYLAVKNIPFLKEALTVKDMSKDLYRDYQNAMQDTLNEEAMKAQAYEQEMPNYRRGGAVRKKAKMMRKGGMSDKKGRAMKSKSKDSRGRAMRGY